MSLVDALLLDPAPFDVWIAIRTDGLKGSGTASDPYNGSDQTRFDAVMASVAAQFPNQKVAIHLGPGTFITAGYALSGGSPWQLKAGMKILGSGREVTVIKRANGNTSGYVLGHDLTTAADDFELSDLTLDCNLMNTAGTTATCGAVRVMGSHVRLTRVRAKSWGCSVVSGTGYVFALVLANPPSVGAVANSGMEGCIADAPAKLVGTPANAGTMTLFYAGPPSGAGVQQEGYALSPYIRNCFGQWDASITGTQCRGLSMNWCRGGIVEGNHIYEAAYGAYQKDASAQDVIVRNNYFRNAIRGLFWDSGTVYPASAVSLNGLIQDLNADSSGKTALATTDANPLVSHGYQVGEHVRIMTGDPASPYDGIFRIKEVPAPNQFRYVMLSRPQVAPVTPFKHQKVFGVGRIIAEGNVIMMATSGASYAIQLYDQKIMEGVPTDVFGDTIVRNNKIRYVDGLFDPAYTGDGIQINGATNVIVTDNVLDVAPSNPVRLFRCRNVTCQNNRESSGSLIEGYNTDTAEHYGELETDNDFALVMSLFNRRAR